MPTMVGAPEPDPVSRSFGTWAVPPAPTSRPDFIVAAQQAQNARAVAAANDASDQVDLTSVRDLFPEPRWEGEREPVMPVAPAPPVSRDDQPAQAAGVAQRGVVSEEARTADAREVAMPVAAATATGSQDAVDATSAESAGPLGGERVRHGQDLGRNASRSDQARSAGDTGGPAGPVGPNDAAGTDGEPVDVTPPTKQSRYWATGAHASAFVGAWMGGVPAFVGPLVVWLARKDNDPFAAEHGRNALNFNLSVIVYVLGLIIVSIITFGIGLLVTIPGFILLGLAWFALTLVGTIKAASSETYTYPLTIKFVR